MPKIRIEVTHPHPGKIEAQEDELDPQDLAPSRADKTHKLPAVKPEDSATDPQTQEEKTRQCRAHAGNDVETGQKPPDVGPHEQPYHFGQPITPHSEGWQHSIEPGKSHPPKYQQEPPPQQDGQGREPVMEGLCVEEVRPGTAGRLFNLKLRIQKKGISL